eukprot:NODE_14765_length_1088_cov_3.005203.p3 GENE.NODE_14765_length_1088_cov_3.005203~~NODE_14765_length_1088_cov_3.005203.p3  ORF type:complete len:75 (+),score=13.44 NODE_14765_length_1088_cov_3.005203:66-290(+)
MPCAGSTSQTLVAQLTPPAVWALRLPVPSGGMCAVVELVMIVLRQVQVAEMMMNACGGSRCCGGCGRRLRRHSL